MDLNELFSKQDLDKMSPQEKLQLAKMRLDELQADKDSQKMSLISRLTHAEVDNLEKTAEIAQILNLNPDEEVEQ